MVGRSIPGRRGAVGKEAAEVTGRQNLKDLGGHPRAKGSCVCFCDARNSNHMKVRVKLWSQNAN